MMRFFNNFLFCLPLACIILISAFMSRASYSLMFLVATCMLVGILIIVFSIKKVIQLPLTLFSVPICLLVILTFMNRYTTLVHWNYLSGSVYTLVVPFSYFYSFYLQHSRVCLSWLRVSIAILVVLVFICYPLYQVFWLHVDPNGPLHDKNLVGVFVLLLFAHLLPRVLARPLTPNKAVLFQYFLLLLSAFLIFTLDSRSNFLVLCLILLGYFVIMKLKRQNCRQFYSLVFVLTLLAFVGVSVGCMPRLATLSDPMQAGVSRFTIWQATWDMIKPHWFLGSGIGSYAYLYLLYRKSDAYMRLLAHNDYLQYWVMFGIFGISALVAMVIAWGKRMCGFVRRVGCVHFYDSIDALGLGLGLAAVFAMALFTFPFAQVALSAVIGVMLASFDMQTMKPSALRTITIPASVRPALFKILLVTLCVYFYIPVVRTKLSMSYFYQASKYYKGGDYMKLYEGMQKAYRVDPNNLNALKLLAAFDLAAVKEVKTKKEKRLFAKAALDKLAKLRQLNPFFDFEYVFEGQVYDFAKDAISSDWAAKAKIAYIKADAFKTYRDNTYYSMLKFYNEIHDDRMVARIGALIATYSHARKAQHK